MMVVEEIELAYEALAEASLQHDQMRERIAEKEIGDLEAAA